MRFDPHTLKARISPMILILLPLAMSISLWLPLEPLLATSGAVAISIALGMLLAQLGRGPGKRKERDLWRSWGGAPTAQLLRHRDQTLADAAKERAHDTFRLLRPDVRIPSAQEEEADADSADRVYDTLVDYAIGRVRDDRARFPLVDKEVANYGFRRNLWGLKPHALGLLVVAIALAVGRGFWDTSSLSPFAYASLELLVVLLWIFVVSREWVRIPMTQYGRALFQAVETLRHDNESVGGGAPCTGSRSELWLPE